MEALDSRQEMKSHAQVAKIYGENLPATHQLRRRKRSILVLLLETTKGTDAVYEVYDKRLFKRNSRIPPTALGITAGTKGLSEGQHTGITLCCLGDPWNQPGPGCIWLFTQKSILSPSYTLKRLIFLFFYIYFYLFRYKFRMGL